MCKIRLMYYIHEVKCKCSWKDLVTIFLELLTLGFCKLIT